MPGWRQIDPDHGVLIIRSQRAGEAGPKVSRDPSDQHHLWHGFFEAAYLPARRRWIRVRLSSLRCFFFAIRLRRFLMTEPTMRDLSLPATPSADTPCSVTSFASQVRNATHLAPGCATSRRSSTRRSVTFGRVEHRLVRRGRLSRGLRCRLGSAERPAIMGAIGRSATRPRRRLAFPLGTVLPRLGRRTGAARLRRFRLGCAARALALGAARHRPCRTGSGPIRPADLHERALSVSGRPSVRAGRQSDRRLSPQFPAPRVGRRAGAASLRRRGVDLPGLAERRRDRRRQGQPAGAGVRRHRWCGPAQT